MQQFILYQFNFWRYLLVGVGIILSLIFGLIFSPLIEIINSNEWGGYYLLLFIMLSMVLGIYAGAKVSATQFEIETDETGMKIKKEAPLFNDGMPTTPVLWTEIIRIQKMNYYNGEILRMKIMNPPLELEFTNSILKRSADLDRFYAIVKAKINT